MDLKKFTDKSSGKLVPIDHHFGFVPNSVPRQIQFDDETISLLLEASRQIGMLEQEGKRLPNPLVLIDPAVHREAILSSRMEGTITTMRELFEYEVMPSPESRNENKEVSNYIQALRHGLQRIKEKQLCLNVICEMHEKLLTGVRGQDKNPGAFRKVAVGIDDEGRTRNLEKCRFVPPPPQLLDPLLDDFEKYLHENTKAQPLVEIALAHYQFETIHPFRDGNGRVGRLLIPILMEHKKLLSKPLLYLSPYFESNPEEYKTRLFNVSAEGDYVSWVKMFLRAIIEQCKDTIDRSDRLLETIEKYKKKVEKATYSVKAIRLVESLLVTPVITVSKAAEIIGSEFAGASNIVETLEEIGILKETTGQKKFRKFAALELIEIIES